MYALGYSGRFIMGRTGVQARGVYRCGVRWLRWIAFFRGGAMGSVGGASSRSPSKSTTTRGQVRKGRRDFLGRGFGDRRLGPGHLGRRCAERLSIGDQVQGLSATDRATRRPRWDIVWGDIFRTPARQHDDKEKGDVRGVILRTAGNICGMSRLRFRGDDYVTRRYYVFFQDTD